MNRQMFVVNTLSLLLILAVNVKIPGTGDAHAYQTQSKAAPVGSGSTALMGSARSIKMAVEALRKGEVPAVKALQLLGWDTQDVDGQVFAIAPEFTTESAAAWSVRVAKILCGVEPQVYHRMSELPAEIRDSLCGLLATGAFQDQFTKQLFDRDRYFVVEPQVRFTVTKGSFSKYTSRMLSEIAFLQGNKPPNVPSLNPDQAPSKAALTRFLEASDVSVSFLRNGGTWSEAERLAAIARLHAMAKAWHDRFEEQARALWEASFDRTLQLLDVPRDVADHLTYDRMPQKLKSYLDREWKWFDIPGSPADYTFSLSPSGISVAVQDDRNVLFGQTFEALAGFNTKPRTKR